jgi:hypothetical protein
LRIFRENFYIRGKFRVEPFSFFQILQSFLPKPTETPDATPAPVTENPTPTNGQTEPSQPEISNGQNAFLHFIEAHDKRAKRTRK